MLLLAIDTSGPDCAVALARGGAGGPAILQRATERIGRGHAERLMPMLEQALAEAHLDFADLERIAVTIGPGSFTGVRVGIAAARGLALALDVPAVGISTLDAIAAPAFRTGRKQGAVIASLDAKRGEVYALAKDLASGETTIEAHATPADAFAERIAAMRGPHLLCGSGSAQIALAIGADATILTTVESPDIADVSALGLAAMAERPPAPLYLRGADAKPQHESMLALR